MHEFTIYAMHWRALTSKSRQFGNSLSLKQIDVSFLCVCPVIDNEFHHNIVKVVDNVMMKFMVNNNLLNLSI